MDILKLASSKKVFVDASEIEYCDGSGIGLLIELQRRQRKSGAGFEITGLREEFQKLIDLFDPAEFELSPIVKPKKTVLTEEVGKATFTVWGNLHSQISFLGELVVALIYAIGHPHAPIRSGNIC